MPTVAQNKKRIKQLKRVFAKAKEQGFTPEELRENVVLWGFPRLSQCSYQDLKAVERRLGSWYSESPGCATQAQLDFMQKLWIEKSDRKDKISLDAYVNNRLGITNPELLSSSSISRIIQGINQWQ